MIISLYIYMSSLYDETITNRLNVSPLHAILYILYAIC